jgi:type II secretion system protein E
MSKETEEIFIQEMNSTIKVHPSEYISKDELASIYKEVKTEYEEEGNDLFRDNFSALKTFINEEMINQVEKKANIQEEIVKEEIAHSTLKQPISNVIKINAEYISTKPKEEEVIIQNHIEEQEQIEVKELEIVQNNVIEEKEKEVNPVMIETKEEIERVVEQDNNVLYEETKIEEEINTTKEVVAPVEEKKEEPIVNVAPQPSQDVKDEPSEICDLKKVNKFLDMKLGNILQEQFGVSEEAIAEAISYKRALKNIDESNGGGNVLNGRTLGDILIETGIVSQKTIYQALALQKGLDFMPAYTVNARTDYKLYKDEEIYKHFGKLSDLVNNMMTTKSFISHWEANPNDPSESSKRLVIVVTLPENTASIKRLSTILEKKGIKTHVVLSDSSTFDEFKLRYNFVTKEEMENIARYVDQTNPLTGTTVTLREFYSYLLTYAIVEKATDIHILPVGEHLARIVFRKIGELETQFYITYSLYTRIIGFTKTHAGMKTNLNGIPQDGRLTGEQKIENGDLLTNVNIRLKRKDAIVDKGLGVDENSLHYSFPKVSFRISTYPIETSVKKNQEDPYEKLVIRVLNLSSGLTELSDLGLSEQATEEMKLLKERSQGIILIVGPTGSGKSTSLYSLMNSINGLKKNIISFEDPVEMPQMLWSQGQRKVTDNEDTNFDFLQATKAILRQDPDIIMMAEVRDADTARFAIDAANTGHLVLTTLHANTAASAVERLKKLGVDTLDIAISVLAIMSQRIVKKLCPHCRQKVALNDEQKTALLKFDLPKDILEANKYVFEAKKGGCYFCGGKGYQSVTVINEIIPFNKEIKKMVIDGASEIAIRDAADEQKWKTMVIDGFTKSVEGLCDINDVIKRI